MTPSDIISKLEANKEVFRSLFKGYSPDEVKWKPSPEKWSLLEIVCHLYDEEREDFRARVKHTLETPTLPMPKIDPVAWVTERKYMEKNYEEICKLFLDERDESVKWLRSLSSPDWKQIYIHPTAGELPADLFLSNWLAHDYLHFRQLTFTRYQYLIQHFEGRFDYAGNW